MKRRIPLSSIGLTGLEVKVFVAHQKGNWADESNDLEQHQFSAKDDKLVATVDFPSGEEYKIVVFGIPDEEKARLIHSKRHVSGVLRGCRYERFNWDAKHKTYWLLDPDPTIKVIREGEWNANCLAP